MKTLIKMLKPWLLKLLLYFEQKEKDAAINFIEKQLVKLNLPISGEQLDDVVLTVYRAVGQIMENKIKAL